MASRVPCPARPSAFQIQDTSPMTYIVTDACVRCKYTDCVEVCPVDCFYEGENFLVIHPDECIDCGVCEPECPVEAIFEEDAVPEEWKKFIKINYDYFGRDYSGQNEIDIV